MRERADCRTDEQCTRNSQSCARSMSFWSGFGYGSVRVRLGTASLHRPRLVPSPMTVPVCTSDAVFGYLGPIGPASRFRYATRPGVRASASLPALALPLSHARAAPPANSRDPVAPPTRLPLLASPALERRRPPTSCFKNEDVDPFLSPARLAKLRKHQVLAPAPSWERITDPRLDPIAVHIRRKLKR